MLHSSIYLKKNRFAYRNEYIIESRTLFVTFTCNNNFKSNVWAVCWCHITLVLVLKPWKCEQWLLVSICGRKCAKVYTKPDNRQTAWQHRDLFCLPPQRSSRQLHILDPLALPQRGCRVVCQWYKSCLLSLCQWPLAFALCLWTDMGLLSTQVKG